MTPAPTAAPTTGDRAREADSRHYDEGRDARGRPRPAYAALARRLGHDPLRPPAEVAARLADRPLGDDARIVPLALALDDREYRACIQAGVAQRARALRELFIDIVLGDGRGLGDAVGLSRPLLEEILVSEGTSLERLRRGWRAQARDAVRFVYAADLARDADGRWLVLEDNVGCVGGCADAHFVLDAYHRALPGAGDARGEPDLARAVRRWLHGLALAPDDPGVVALLADAEPARRLGEDSRRAQLIRTLGVRVVDDAILERLSRDAQPLKAVVNLGAHSSAARTLLRETLFERRRVPLLDAPGTGMLGSKALLPFVADLVRTYCGEEPLLVSPATLILRDGSLPADRDGWVVKLAAGCGGAGVHVLRSLPNARLDEVCGALRGSWPARAAVAQRYVEPSRLGTRRPQWLVELRAFAYVLGSGEVLAAETPLAKLVPADGARRLHNVSRGASYAPVIRVPAAAVTPAT